MGFPRAVNCRCGIATEMGGAGEPCLCHQVAEGMMRIIQIIPNSQAEIRVTGSSGVWEVLGSAW